MLTAKQGNGTELAAHYQTLNDRLHQHVVDLLELSVIGTMSSEAVTRQLTKVIEQLLQQESVPLNPGGRAQVTHEESEAGAAAGLSAAGLSAQDPLLHGEMPERRPGR